jgi:hypothetical protein
MLAIREKFHRGIKILRFANNEKSFLLETGNNYKSKISKVKVKIIMFSEKTRDDVSKLHI